MRHLISCKAAAEYLGLKFNTLEMWRSNGKNLPFYKIGGCVRYAIEDLDAYLHPGTKAKQKPLAPEWLTTTQASEYLGGIGVNTLRRWRCDSQNLTYYKQDNRVQYLNLDLEKFLDSHRYATTAWWLISTESQYIYRVDVLRRGKHTHGWCARIQSPLFRLVQNKPLMLCNRLFSDGVYGSPTKAFEEAQAYIKCMLPELKKQRAAAALVRLRQAQKVAGKEVKG